MKKQLRKKKHVGEFREFGFHIVFEFSETLSLAERNTLLDNFLHLAIESNNLVFGGGAGNRWEGFVTLKDRGSASEAHRHSVEQWLAQAPNILNYNRGATR